MLSQGEIYNSLKDLPAKKTPGNDGLSKEFYLAFYDLLGKDLQNSFEKGKLAPSQYQTVIVLIEKRGKNRRYIRNWRPISLLNVDTKIQECYKHSFEKGKLAPSQYQAVIVLIEKRGKNRRYVRNWRPIPLLNVDTKILSKALASHLKKVITQLIFHDQTAYVPKRNICKSIRLTSDPFEYADSHPISAYMVTADMKKF